MKMENIEIDFEVEKKFFLKTGLRIKIHAEKSNEAFSSEDTVLQFYVIPKDEKLKTLTE